MTTLVFGGTGLVGTALKKYKPDWTYLGSSSGNLLKKEECEFIFKHYMNKDKGIKQIIFLAANVGGLYKNMDNNLDIYLDNMKMQMNVMECSAKFGIEKGIFCLSTCIFPDKIDSYPIKEDMLHQGLPHTSNEGYAFAKRNLEVMCRMYNKRTSRARFTCITPTNIYGENDNFNLSDGHVLPVLIHKAHLASENDGRKFILRGTGGALRQFIYSQDVARLIIRILETKIEIDNIILTPSEEKSIKEVAEHIASRFGIDEIYYDKKYSDGQYKKTASNELIRKIFPDFKFTPFETGIDNTINWFLKYYPNVRK